MMFLYGWLFGSGVGCAATAVAWSRGRAAGAHDQRMLQQQHDKDYAKDLTRLYALTQSAPPAVKQPHNHPEHGHPDHFECTVECYPAIEARYQENPHRYFPKGYFDGPKRPR